MGSNVGKDKVLCSVVTQAVKQVSKIPVWVKLTPATANIVEEAEACFRGGADAVVSSNTFPSLPVIDPVTLEFEMNVDGYVSSGGLGGPAILPLSLAKMSQLTREFPDKEFSGIGGIANFDHALNYFLLGCGTVAGLHRRNARPRHRPERDQSADRRHGRIHGRTRLQIPRRFPQHPPRPHRPPQPDQSAPTPANTTAAMRMRRWKGYAARKGWGCRVG